MVDKTAVTKRLQFQSELSSALATFFSNLTDRQVIEYVVDKASPLVLDVQALKDEYLRRYISIGIEDDELIKLNDLGNLIIKQNLEFMQSK